VTSLAFEKWEGTGNDFLLVEADDGALSASKIRALCDRHFGVGGDGVLLVAKPSAKGAAARMIVQNADGSRPEMCGNGLRCVAAYVLAKRGGSAGSIVIETDAGLRGCEVDGERVTIDMGTGVRLGEITVRVGEEKVALSRVSMGNPHAITFEALGEGALERLARPIAIDPAFPDGTNVELCRVAKDGSIDVLVWERGVGPTLACGTGACAVAVEACARGLAGYGSPITVRLPGGALLVTVTKELRVRMEGPARRVFSGEVTT
jgi:diaminopimelate epimerase